MRRPMKAPRFDSFQPSSVASSRVKRANKRDGGEAERLLRRELWKRGFRYRKQVENLPGQPDIVFSAARLCVFVDGDFWHGRDWEELRRKLASRANPDYWIPKIAYNRKRDEIQTRILESADWTVIRLWEKDVLRNVGSAVDQVASKVQVSRIP